MLSLQLLIKLKITWFNSYFGKLYKIVYSSKRKLGLDSPFSCFFTSGLISKRIRTIIYIPQS